MKKIHSLLLLVVLCILPGCSSPSLATTAPLPEDNKPSVPESLIISVVGDIMVHDTELNAAYQRNTSTYDFTSFFATAKPLLQAADLTIGNLETTFAGPKGGYSGYPRFNSPEVLATNLKEAGFDVLTTANNHCLDRGESGLVQTIRSLDEAGVLHTGTFTTKEEQSKLLITEVKGIKIAILAYTYGMNGYNLPKNSMAAVNMLDPEHINKDIIAAKEQGAKLVLVSLHFGEEYRPLPTTAQTQLAQELLKAGADAILGHHPHVLEPIVYSEKDSPQRNKGKLVAYSLGNFVSDQKGVERKSSLILNLHFELDPLSKEPSLTKATFVPIWTHRYKEQGRLAFRIVPIEAALVSVRTGRNDYFTPADIKELEQAWRHVLNTIPTPNPRIGLYQLPIPLQGLQHLITLENT